MPSGAQKRTVGRVAALDRFGIARLSLVSDDSEDKAMPIAPSQLAPLQGDERFAFGSSVLDFWRWSMGDLRMNTARGLLVEFFVARAVGSPAPIRVEWAAFDVEAADGTRIEVKTSGYLQSWAQRKPSAPSYTFKSAYAESVWNETTGTMDPVNAEDRVHVWVFALHICTEPARYDPLDMSQWEFRVVAHRRLFRTGQQSGRLSFFERLGIEPVSYDGLCDAIASARAEHEQLGFDS